MNNLENEELIDTLNLESLSLKNYQNHIRDCLETVFPNTIVQTEWNAMRDERELNIYSPRIDVAVGPFATHQRCEDEYDRMVNDHKLKDFIERLIQYNRENLLNHGDFVVPRSYEEIIYENRNARSFMAIEIENMVSRKHLMGGAINASALARIGIVIPWSNDKLNAFVRLFRYLHYLKLAEKNTFNTSNLLIVTKDQFFDALNA